MFLNAGQTMRYERIATYKEEKYELLHTFWYVMPSGQKQIRLDIISRRQYEYTDECVQEIHKTCKVLLSYMNDLCICLLMAREHTQMVQMGITQKSAA